MISSTKRRPAERPYATNEELRALEDLCYAVFLKDRRNFVVEMHPDTPDSLLDDIADAAERAAWIRKIDGQKVMPIMLVAHETPGGRVRYTLKYFCNGRRQQKDFSQKELQRYPTLVD